MVFIMVYFGDPVVLLLALAASFSLGGWLVVALKVDS